MTPRLVFIFLAVLIFCSIGFTWYRYIVKEDFAYFLTEDETPDQFSIDSYR